MNEKRIADIEARWKATTSGPWEHQHDPFRGENRILAPALKFSPSIAARIWERNDAEFMAHSWEDVRDLIEEIRRLRATLLLGPVMPDIRHPLPPDTQL